MEQLYFDTNIYSNADLSFQFPQLMSLLLGTQEDVLSGQYYDLEPVNLEANQEVFNLMFLQNQLIQNQNLGPDSQLTTPTDEMFIQNTSNLSYGNWSNDSNISFGETVVDSRLPLTPEFDINLRTPFLVHPSMLGSTLLKGRSTSETHRSLDEVASGIPSRPASAAEPSSTMLYSPGGLSMKFPHEEIKRVKKGITTVAAKAPVKINNNFIREYNNKKIQKFIKGTKKTNKGYKNFINYKCTGDNFERD